VDGRVAYRRESDRHTRNRGARVHHGLTLGVFSGGMGSTAHTKIVNILGTCLDFHCLGHSNKKVTQLISLSQAEVRERHKRPEPCQLPMTCRRCLRTMPKT
jgi:hypothetical protein